MPTTERLSTRRAPRAAAPVTVPAAVPAAVSVAAPAAVPAAMAGLAFTVLTGIALVLAGLGVAACGPSGGGGAPAGPGTGTGTGAGAVAPPTLPPLPRSAPQRITIPSIGVDAPVTPVGLDTAGRLEVPPLNRPNLTGWYSGGPSPGELGPAVIEGHVDSKSGPSVFYRLSRLATGARVEVTRQDGSHVVFQVRQREQVDKDAFPTSRVYGPVDYAALRLITCGGAFDRAKGSYEDNIIVYAHRIAA